MTWEEVIISARKNPDYQELIYQCYLGENLVENAERFRFSEEFVETTRLIESYNQKPTLKLLDIGCGNGISAVSLALHGYDVTAVEPDPSTTVGREAIKKLVEHFKLDIHIIEGVGENLPLPDQCFDVVYMRQTLHHASSLDLFLKQSYRVLKPGGIIFTVRDHVVYGEKDKEWFLTSHPFHRFYGGENAFKKKEYIRAFKNAGFHIIKMMKHYDSVLNYFPLSKKEFNNYPIKMKEALREKLIQKTGVLGKLFLVQLVFRWYKGLFPIWYNEKLIPGRLYSFIAIKR